MAELLGLSILFVIVAVATVIAARLPIPKEALYLLTGVIIVQVSPVPDTILLAEAGAVFVIFLATMHLRTDAFADVLGPAMWVTIAHTGVLIGLAAAAIWFGFGLYEAVLIAAIGTFSSSMLGINIIDNQFDRRMVHARLTEAINFSEDLIAVLLIGALPFWPDTGNLTVAAAGTGAVMIAMLIARKPMRTVLERLEHYEETTLLFGLTVLWGTVTMLHGFAYGTVIAAVGAGLLLSGHPENVTLLEALQPVRDFFATLFFVSLGLLVVAPAQADLVLVMVLVVIISIIQPVITLTVLYWRGTSLHSSVLSSLQLDQPSEIILLLGLVFHVNELVSDTVSQAIILAAGTTFIISAYTTRHADAIYHRLVFPFAAHRAPIKRAEHVIIAGYGTRGTHLARDVPDAVIIDNDTDRVRTARQNGHRAVLGDINDRSTWKRTAADEAACIVLTIPSDSVARQLATYDTGLIAVTETIDAAKELTATGAIFAADTATIVRSELTARLQRYLTELHSTDGEDREV